MQRYERLDYREECVNHVSDSVEGSGNNLQIIMSNTNLRDKTNEKNKMKSKRDEICQF